MSGSTKCQTSIAAASTTTNHPRKKIKTEQTKGEEEIPPLPMLLHRKDIWVGNILPFLGIGNYIFVAGICKDMKEIYQDYFSSEEKKDNLPEVDAVPYQYHYRKVVLTDTFYREAFASLSRAKFWIKGRILRNDRLPSNRICETIAKYGNIQVLEWAHKRRGFQWDRHVCQTAARGGQLEALEYLHDNGCPWDSNTCMFAASAGRLDILKYAHENGCPWDWRTCSWAARVGRLDILQYSHDNGCPWDENTCEVAAEKGRLDILKYAHENGCPWDWWTWRAASQSVNREIFEYVKKNGCPEPESDSEDDNPESDSGDDN